jgi:hypothetical protein
VEADSTFETLRHIDVPPIRGMRMLERLGGAP